MARERDALDEAVAGLYREFQAHRLRGWTEPCMHCHTEEDERAVHRRPLRELQPQDLAGFAGDSLMTWGEVVDLKHFLPRLFEILAIEGFPGGYPDMETVVGALDRGAWRTWPAHEQDAVERFLSALWQAHLADHPSTHQSDTVLSAIATAVDDMTPYLTAWLAAEGDAPTIHFAAFLLDNQGYDAPRGRLSNPWLRNRPTQAAQVRRWLADAVPHFAPRFEAAFLATSDDRTLDLLASAIDTTDPPPR